MRRLLHRVVVGPGGRIYPGAHQAEQPAQLRVDATGERGRHVVGQLSLGHVDRRAEDWRKANGALREQQLKRALVLGRHAKRPQLKSPALYRGEPKAAGGQQRRVRLPCFLRVACVPNRKVRVINFSWKAKCDG